MQSSKKRFGPEHREGDLCWSLSDKIATKSQVYVTSVSATEYNLDVRASL